MTRSWLWIVLLAVSAGYPAPARGAVLLDTDFGKGTFGWSLLRSAGLIGTGDLLRPQLLRLTGGSTPARAAAWTEIRRRVPSFTFIAELRLRFTPSSPEECPGFGVALVFAPVETDAIGGTGNALGLCGNDEAIRQFVAIELNTSPGQGLGTVEERQGCIYGKHETFALDLLRPSQSRTATARSAGGGTPERGGFKIGQTVPPSGMQLVNGGWYRYQWNVEADGTVALFVTGLDPGNREFQKVKVLETKLATNPLNLFDGRWGFTATSRGDQATEIARVTIESPSVAPR